MQFELGLSFFGAQYALNSHSCVFTGASGLLSNTTGGNTAGMENTLFEKLSPLEVCQKMWALCQQSADETSPGAQRERLQAAANRFKEEAIALKMEDKAAARGFRDEAKALAD